MPEQQQTSQLSALFRAATLHDLHKTAVDLALRSKNGHLDLFLRFLLGLSLESNQSLFRLLLLHTSSQSQSSEQTVQLVKHKIRDQDESDRRINLFYCLNELNQHVVVEHTDRSSGTLSVVMLLPGEWRTGKFKFETSEEYLDEFDLQKCIKTPEKDQTELLSPDDVLQKLMQSDVFTSSTSAKVYVLPSAGSSATYVTAAPKHCPTVPSTSVASTLYKCPLTEKSCSYLASVLTSHSSSLTQLQLRNNKLQESGGELLCSALCHPNCKLEKLELYECPLTEKSCSYLASVLTSHSSSLTQLQLKGGQWRSSSLSSVHLSSSAGCHPDCKRWELRLEGYNVTEEICSYLLSALTSHTSTLSGRYLRKEEVELLCSALCHQHCRLEKLELDECPLTEKSCSYLASVLTSHSSSLTQLQLDVYIQKDSAAKKLCALQKDPHYQVEMSISGGYSYPYKRWLYLSCTVLQDSDVKTLSAHCQQQSQDPIIHLSSRTIIHVGSSRTISMATAASRMEPTTTIRVESTTTIRVESSRTIRVESTTTIRVESTTTIRVESNRNIRVESTTTIRVESTTAISVESTTTMRVESTTTIRVESTTTIRVESSECGEIVAHRLSSCQEQEHFLQFLVALVEPSGGDSGRSFVPPHETF
ncbi:hypothetical protein ACEWY4_007959 [Coilia grayii]|uniref:NACHT LRR and PYD domain-containing protein n=1 Tax=Coilia grayii TaxID=363190 RepID=A0ABD1K9Q0_9TELE